MSRSTPSRTLMRWLGRQAGHIRCAVRGQSADESRADRSPVVWSDQRVDETQHPSHPELVLRRTTIDEVVVKPAPSSS